MGTVITDQDVVEYVTGCLPSEDLADYDLDGIVATLIRDFDITGEVGISDEQRLRVHRKAAFLDEAIDSESFWRIVEDHYGTGAPSL